MKTTKFISGLMAIVLGMCMFVSCGSDDDDDPEPPVPPVTQQTARYVAGSYAGELDVNIMGQDFTFPDKTFKLTETADDKVSVVIPGFSHGGIMNVTESTVPDVAVAADGEGVYSLRRTEFSGEFEGDQKYPYTGTIEGMKLADGSFEAQVRLSIGAMPMPMICKFSGK